MSLIIKGMEMPESCFDCSIFDNFCQERCGVTGTLVYGEIDPQRETLPDCPLIPLPEGHGRLIDAEAYVDYMQNRYDNNEITNGDWIDFRLSLKDQPTIVPAEGGTDNG